MEIKQGCIIASLIIHYAILLTSYYVSWWLVHLMLDKAAATDRYKINELLKNVLEIKNNRIVRRIFIHTWTEDNCPSSHLRAVKLILETYLGSIMLFFVLYSLNTFSCFLSYFLIACTNLIFDKTIKTT